MTGSCGLVKGFGATIRKMREAKQWSQETLAERADLNRSYIGEIERGSVVVSILTLEKLAAAFSVPVSSLLAQTEAVVTGQLVKGIELTSIAC